MSIIDEQIARFKSLDISTLLDEVIDETSDQLIDLVQSQLRVGISGTGEGITPEYRQQSYADFKKSIVGSLAPYFTPDLKLEGDFYRGFFVQTNLLGVEVYSSDWKAAKLESKYGNGIFGLTEENTSKYAKEIVYPLLIEKIRKHLNYTT